MSPIFQIHGPLLDLTVSTELISHFPLKSSSHTTTRILLLLVPYPQIYFSHPRVGFQRKNDLEVRIRTLSFLRYCRSYDTLCSAWVEYSLLLYASTIMCLRRCGVDGREVDLVWDRWRDGMGAPSLVENPRTRSCPPGRTQRSRQTKSKIGA